MGETESVSIERTKDVIARMTEDVLRESDGEVVDTMPLRKEIGNRTAKLFKQHLNIIKD
jgi:hypothetical protein